MQFDDPVSLGDVDDTEYYRNESGCDAIRDQLDGRFIFDDEQVLNQLRVDEVDSRFVDHCFANFYKDNVIAIKEFKEVEDMAGRVSQWDPEKKKGWDNWLCTPMDTLFQHIERMDRPDKTSGRPHRAFLPTYGHAVASKDSYMTGFPRIAPDFTLSRAADVKSRRWSEEDGFCIVKATRNQGPKPSNDQDPKEVKEIVCQSAAYARLHLSARPFFLFTVGLLSFGSDFCVAIFNRAGISFSPIKNLWTNTKDFIRIVRRMTRVMATTELGQDPSVSILPPEISNIFNLDGYPSFRIPAIGSDYHEWCTVGRPIWSSMTLFGRGTMVWNVLEYREGFTPHLASERIMKMTWRDPNRPSESEIYQSIRGGYPKGLARFLTGGDVRNSTGQTIAVAAVCNTAYHDTLVLHRVILNTVGRPLWTYASELELLKGMFTAASAHKYLSDQHFIHGDVSPGNILLAKDSEVTQEDGAGFLIDLESAQLPPNASIEVVEFVPPQKRTRTLMTPPTLRRRLKFLSGSRPHIELTGTLLFMAYDLLVAMRDKDDMEQTEEHDIESFMLVAGYAVLRKLLENCKDNEEYKLLYVPFRAAFGPTSLDSIIVSRRADAALEWIGNKSIAHIVERHVSPSVRSLLYHFWTLVKKRRDTMISTINKSKFTLAATMPNSDAVNPPFKLHHSDLLDSLSIAITQLESEMGQPAVSL